MTLSTKVIMFADHVSGINWVGMKTLYMRETLRFLKVWNQTVTAPLVTTLLFLAIFSLAMGGSNHEVDGVPFNLFIAPGLIMMAVVQNAFANTTSSLMLSKIQGVIIDYLMPPISALEMTIGMALGGVTRGLMVGIVVSAGIYIFVPYEIHDWTMAFLFIVLSSLMLALLGILAGVWAQTFDQLAAITNYIITPLSFLSGTFYPVKQLPDFWYGLAHLDPFFYMIDGFRYALTGYSDSSPLLGLIVLLVINVILFAATHIIINKGYRLKN